MVAHCESGGGSGAIGGSMAASTPRFGSFYTGRPNDELDLSHLHELTKPHVESFDYFVERGLEEAVRRLQPVELKHPISGTNLRYISESAESLAYLSPFSQRDRPAVNDLTGSWKVFEMSATAIHQPGATLQTRPSYAHFCQEVMLKQGLPEALQMYVDEDGAEPVEDPVVLWLPGGITASV